MDNLTETILGPFIETGARGFNRKESSLREIGIAESIYRLMEPISVEDPVRSNYRELWLKIPRGAIESAATFEEFEEIATWEEMPYTEESWYSWFEDWYPHLEYWHRVWVNADHWQDVDYLSLGIDNYRIVEKSDRKPVEYEREGSLECLYALEKLVEKTMLDVSTGKYEQFVQDNIPHSFRWGLINRREWWDVTESASWLGRSDMEDKEASILADLLRRQKPWEEFDRIESLTTGHYFEALKNAYKAAGYEFSESAERRRNEEYGWDNSRPIRPYNGVDYTSFEDGRAWYFRFGDARDRSLIELDQDSDNALKGWLEGKKRFGLDHNFEIFVGRGCSRVHCNPVFDELGWALEMYGSITWHAADMARVWRSFNEAGIPCYMHSAAELADALEGKDMLLVTPAYESADYLRGEHFGHEISTAIYLGEKHKNELIPLIEWQPVETVRLKKSFDEGS